MSKESSSRSFVSVDGEIAKLLEKGDSVATVEFFDAPVEDGREVAYVPLERVRPASIEPQTRCWWNEDGRWRAGRVESSPDDLTDELVVAFPENVGRVLSPEELFIRWSRPLRDPVRLLIGGISDSRYFQRTRRRFMQEMHNQRAASAGLTSILSSSIELHRHQVSAARQVLLDPTRRYLLADEVGLGKTIEAGIVIRQTLIDEPRSSVVALVPDELVVQWEDELNSKFHVRDHGESSVDVLPHSVLRSPDFAIRADLLVVDEAHRLTSSTAANGMYGPLTRLAHESEALLLLTATPVRSNEDTFLRLLHLLDPETYDVDDVESFRHRVEQRDGIGHAITLLAEDVPPFLIGSASETLRNAFPEDRRLSGILDELDRAVQTDSLDELSVHTERARRYVSEKYRLHHRMIRTRRTGRLAKYFPVRGRKRAEDWRLEDTSPSRVAVVEALDRFRLALVADGHPDSSPTLRVVAARCNAADPAIEVLARAVLAGDDEDINRDELSTISWLRESEDGIALASELLEAVEAPTWSEDPSRVALAATWAWGHASRKKVAACTNFTSVGRALNDEMSRRYGAHRVAALLSGMSEEELVSEFKRAISEPQCTLLVCDRVSEEGWNLQRFEEVLHLDLPWSTNRLEQRLGRFDRWTSPEAGSNEVLSTVFCDRTPLDRITGSWTRLVADGFGAFETSTASLQYVLPTREDAAIERALQEGFESVDIDVEEERIEIERERKTIQGQDLLDSTEVSDEDDNFFDQLLASDRRADRKGRAITDWLSGTLRLTMSDGPPWRFGVSSKNPPLIPNQQVESLGMHHFRPSYVVGRTDALGTGSPILRSGSSLLDNVFDLCEVDDRGLSFVGYTTVTGMPAGADVTPLFNFDFIIETDLKQLGVLSSQRKLSLERRATLLFPPMLTSVWFILGHGEPPKHIQSLAESEATESLWSEPELLAELTSGFDWVATCRKAEQEAGKAVLSRDASSVALAAATQRLRAWQSQHELSKVLRAHDPTLQNESCVEDLHLLAEVLSRVTVRVMSCGVTLLGPQRGTNG